MSRKLLEMVTVVLLTSIAGGVTAGDPAVVDEGSEKIPWNATLYVPCANGGSGEDVFFEGFLHARWILMLNGSRYTYTENYNPQGVTGTGVVTGDTYRATGKTSYSSTGDLADDMPSEFTFVNRFHLVGPGPGNDFYIKQTDHVTVTPDGDAIASHSFSGITCN